MIIVKNLTKKFKKSEALAVDDISFQVKSGEFFSFLGPNGAGKTTTISILTTLLSKSSGEVKIDGLDINDNQTEVRKRIGIIFQNPSLDQNLTAEENIRFHCSLYGVYDYKPLFSMMPSEYKNKILELLQIVGLDSKELNTPISKFSGGMKRKLEIVRSLMHNPKILFLDEPTTGLDPLSRKTLWKYLNEMRLKTGTTIFLTTHYLDEAENCDHIAIIKKGKIVFDGTPSEMRNMLSEEAKNIVRTGPSLEDAYLQIIEEK
jgi:ABC-2 type transport system ATP-binding protein